MIYLKSHPCMLGITFDTHKKQSRPINGNGIVCIVEFITIQYNLSFYFQYLSTWPDYFVIGESPSGKSIGYIMGKAEGEGKLWHGHVTALTVHPDFRRMGVARKLMAYLEDVSENMYCRTPPDDLILRYNAYFVDLFVRSSNMLARSMYEKFGYIVYRRVLGYYTGLNPEDALDMRKALRRDVKKESVVPLTKPVYPEDLEWH